MIFYFDDDDTWSLRLLPMISHLRVEMYWQFLSGELDTEN